MTISDIRSQLKQAMLQKDAEKTSVIRMLLSSISYSAMSSNKKDDDMTEADIDSVIMKEVKSRTEAIEEFQANGKVDLVVKEKAELDILKEFAPKMMDEDETRDAVTKILADVDPNLAIGPAMGMVMKSLKGKVDTSIVNKIIQEVLKK